MDLSKFISGVAWKALSDVEINPNTSNQHEFNGVRGLKDILGSEKKRFETTFLFFGSLADESVTFQGLCTWYDARENHPIRSEFRLYYTPNEVIQKASIGDLFLFAKITNTDKALCLVCKQGSPFEGEIRWLFGISGINNQFVVNTFSGVNNKKITLPVRLALENFGLTIDLDSSDFDADSLLSKYETFPKTDEFSELARQSLVGDYNSIDDPDNAIILFLEREELLFRHLEKKIIGSVIQTGFLDSSGIANVDSFIAFSLSVQNRRKARVGQALEHHLESIFKKNEVKYDRGKATENKSKPDFIFPNIGQYRNLNFDDSKLTMLGAKSSCKDRWRQVLSEASRIQTKHLFTLERAISQNQTDEMRASQLQLVVPEIVKTSYNENQSNWLWNLRDFINHVKSLNP